LQSIEKPDKTVKTNLFCNSKEVVLSAFKVNTNIYEKDSLLSHIGCLLSFFWIIIVFFSPDSMVLFECFGVSGS
jgi:hypothetical protein